MRRTEREVTDPAAIESILAGCDCCYLALADQGAPYIIPLNFGFGYEDGRLCLYFHCASQGKKLALIHACAQAAFAMSCAHRLIESNRACAYSFAYQSVCGRGEIDILPHEEKDRALRCVMRQYTKKAYTAWSGSALARVTLLRLRVTQITAKCASGPQPE